MLQSAEVPSVPPAGESRDDSRERVIGALFREHNRALVSFLAARLRSEAEAHDVAQEAYVRLLQLDSHGAVSFLRAYLFRIASNLAVDRIRQRAVRELPQPDPVLEALADERAPDRIAMAREDLETVRAALTELPEKCRSAFCAYVFDGSSTMQIATELGVTDRMVRMYVAKGLAACREQVDLGRRARSGGP